MALFNFFHFFMETDSNEIVEPEVPSFDEFNERLSEIYAEGDLKLSYNRMLWYFKHIQFNDKPITWEFLLMKFKQHIDEWNLMYGPKLGTQYFPTKAYALRKSFYDFLGDRFYEREFVTSIGHNERNKYLFGDFTIGYLSMELEEFKKRFTDETEKQPD